MHAFVYADVDCAQLLIDLGANPLVVIGGENILHCAASSDKIESVQLAFKYCQNVTQKDDHGITPFQCPDPQLPEYSAIRDLLEQLI